MKYMGVYRAARSATKYFSFSSELPEKEASNSTPEQRVIALLADEAYARCVVSSGASMPWTVGKAKVSLRCSTASLIEEWVVVLSPFTKV